MEQNRRDFLKASSLFAGGALLKPLSGYGSNSAVDETIRVALIGCGGRGTGAAARSATPIR